MRTRTAVQHTLLLLALAVTAAPAAEPLATQGTKVVDLIVAGKFNEAVKGFDATMTTALPPGKLREVWEGLTKQLGAYRDHGAARTATEQGYQVVYVPCRFEKGSLDAKVVYDGKGQVAGLFFIPAK